MRYTRILILRGSWTVHIGETEFGDRAQSEFERAGQLGTHFFDFDTSTIEIAFEMVNGRKHFTWSGIMYTGDNPADNEMNRKLPYIVMNEQGRVRYGQWRITGGGVFPRKPK